MLAIYSHMPTAWSLFLCLLYDHEKRTLLSIMMEGSERKKITKEKLNKAPTILFDIHNFPIAQRTQERHWCKRKNVRWAKFLQETSLFIFISLIYFEANSWHSPCSFLHLCLLSPMSLSHSLSLSLCFSKPYSILVSFSLSLPLTACLKDTAIQHSTLEPEILTQALNPN